MLLSSTEYSVLAGNVADATTTGDNLPKVLRCSTR
jgi:hypothetical protein